jgi:DNA-binding transcriptional MerR regulator
MTLLVIITFRNSIFITMGHYSILELEKLTGILAATLRVWERRYHIIKPHRTKTNRRWYDDDDLRHLLNITILYRNGIKISKIAAFSQSEIEEKASILTRDIVNYDTCIDSMIMAMISFNKNAVNEILLRSIINKGFEETFIGLVFPFLRKVGILWHTGYVNTGAEHFISNIFRSRLISAIDALIQPDSRGRKRVIMYLPDNELHELSLLFYAYLIIAMGYEVIYLGQSTPVDSVIEVNEKWHSDILVTGTVSGMPFTRPGEYLDGLSTTFSKQKILVAGLLADEADKKSYPNVFSLRSVRDLKNHLS